MRTRVSDRAKPHGWLDDFWKLSVPADGASEVAWEGVAGNAAAAGYAPPLGWVCECVMRLSRTALELSLV
jgi:hypothetical protein